MLGPGTVKRSQEEELLIEDKKEGGLKKRVPIVNHLYCMK